VDIVRANDLDVNERLNNLERSLVHVLARLDKAEESIQKCMLAYLYLFSFLCDCYIVMYASGVFMSFDVMIRI
jgi:hypothetical protein